MWCRGNGFMLALSQYKAERRIDPIYTQLAQVPRTLLFTRLCGARSRARQMWKMGTTGLKGQPMRLFTLARGAKDRHASSLRELLLINRLTWLSSKDALRFDSLAASRVAAFSATVLLIFRQAPPLGLKHSLKSSSSKGKMHSSKILAAALTNNFASALASFLVSSMHALCSAGTRRKKSLTQRRH